MRKLSATVQARVQLAKALDALYAIPAIGKGDIEVDKAYQEVWSTATRLGFVVSLKNGRHLVELRPASK